MSMLLKTVGNNIDLYNNNMVFVFLLLIIGTLFIL